MIKVQNHLIDDPKNPLCEVINDAAVIAALLERGISLDPKHSNPDFHFVSANITDPNDIPPRSICFERIDGAQIRFREHLKQPNCLRLVKMYYYGHYVTDLECVDGRPHTRVINEGRFPMSKPSVELTRAEKDKVVLGPNFLHYKRHDLAVKKIQEFTEKGVEKDIDVFFAGTLQYGDSEHGSGILITEHRQTCVAALKDYKDKHPKKNVVIVEGRELGHTGYIKNLCRAKITVSPWGWGEPCYRDYEANLASCHVIKPYGYVIRTLCNPKPYYGVQPDWSDLDLAIRELSEVEHEGPDRLMAMRTPEWIANNIAEIIGGIE